MKDKDTWIDKLFLKSFRPYLWIIGLGFLLYFKVLFYGLTYLDDNVTILDNFNNFRNIFNLFRTFGGIIVPAFGSFYRPISALPFILEAQFGAPYFIIYHFTNIALHLAAACLLFIFLIKLGYKRLPALIMSLLFTVHPALTMNVVWIPGRVDVLLSVFVLPSFIFFLDYLRTKRPVYCFWHLLFFSLALFTKETALILVLLCPLYAWLIVRRRGWFFDLIRLAPGWLIISLGWFLIRQAVLVKPAPVSSPALLSSLFNPAAVLLYLGKIVLPFNLAPLPTLQDSSLYYGWAALAIIITLLIFTKMKRSGPIVFGALWFLSFLLPALIFSDPSIFTGVALYEHRIYLPLIGLIILFLETDLFKAIGSGQKLSLAASLIIIILFSALTFGHSGIFKDRLSFWENAAQSSPHHPLARRNLGAMYYLDGRLDQAELEYDKTIELNPAEPMVHNNLGLIYMNRGQLKEAEAEFVKELQINPGYDNALFNLGLLYAREGRFKDARALWEKTLQVNPGYDDARNDLRLIYGK